MSQGIKLSDWLSGDALQGRQPQGPVQIDWSNPLTSGLIAAYDGHALQNLVTGGLPSTNTTTQSIGTSGVGSAYGSGYATLDYNRSTVGSNLTYFLLFDYVQNGGNSFILGDVQAAGADYNAGLYSNGSNFSFFVKNSSGTGASAVGSSSSASQKAVALAGTYDGATIRIYSNGTQAGTNSQTGAVQAHALGMQFGRWNSGSNKNPSTLFVGLVWSRTLSAAEVAAITANPWQIFAPALDIPFPAASSGGSGISVSAAITEGADVLAASIGPLIGVSSAITDAADTLAASVGPIISASAAISEGADTLTASVSPVISVSSATTDAADVLAAAVGPVVSAAASITEGPDTLAAAVSTGFSISAALVESPDVCSATVTPIGAYVPPQIVSVSGPGASPSPWQQASNPAAGGGGNATMGLPDSSMPLVDQSGRMTTAWRQYFENAFQRQGGVAALDNLTLTMLSRRPIPWNDLGSDENEAFPIPGQTGQPGPPGKNGVPIFMLDGSDGEDGMWIPGPPGPMGPSSGGSVVPKLVTQYTSGTGTFTPGGTTTWLRITLVGGGGGGGCANGAPGMGGAAGEVLQIWQPVSGALSYAVGAAGAAGSTSSSLSGGTGGNSTLGSLTAYGGGGGASGSSGSTPSSCGQSCMYGAGGAANGFGPASGNGQGYGAGGGGTIGSTAGAGAPGFIMIEEY